MMTYLSLGSNLGNREIHLDQTIRLISKRIGRILKKSSVYETDPWGFIADLPFLNMVIEVETLQSAENLMNEIIHIEEELGRKRGGDGYISRLCTSDIHPLK